MSGCSGPGYVAFWTEGAQFGPQLIEGPCPTCGQEHDPPTRADPQALLDAYPEDAP